MENLKGFKKPKTFGETLYGFLKAAILTGEIKSGSRLQERDIAQRFDVSVTPVREAFRRLSAEKFLTINARTEVVVEEVTRAKINELFEVISSLDVIASKKAIGHLSNPELKELRGLTERLSSYHKNGKVKDYMKLDLIIHEKIWQSCGNQFLSKLLIELGERYAFYCNNIIANAEDPTTYLLVEDHENLIDALEERDYPRVKGILSLHWGKGLIQDCRDPSLSIGK